MARYMYLASSLDKRFLNNINVIVDNIPKEERPKLVSNPFLERSTIYRYDTIKNVLEKIENPYEYNFTND